MNMFEIKYDGGLRTTAKHLDSGNIIHTDAPKDNHGLGECFSPTDLVASSLCSCMTTVMGIYAKKNKFVLPKSKSLITKFMSSNPRRISKIKVEVNFDNNSLSEIQKQRLVEVAKGCPVAKSLSNELVQEIIFNF